MLRGLRSKQLLIVEQQALLTTACRKRMTDAGATIIGPVSSLDAVNHALATHRVDAVILDVEMDDKFMVELSCILEALNTPFLFAARRIVSAGYSLIDDDAELKKIAAALFCQPPSSTLH